MSDYTPEEQEALEWADETQRVFLTSPKKVKHIKDLAAAVRSRQKEIDVLIKQNLDFEAKWLMTRDALEAAEACIAQLEGIAGRPLSEWQDKTPK